MSPRHLRRITRPTRSRYWLSPDFARGPDDSQAIKVPNDSGNGIPITLYNAVNVTDVTFTLSYNPSLLTASGASNGDATDKASSFTLIASPTITDTTHATARFHFHDGTAQSGTIVLGDIVATVPAKRPPAAYKAKELLKLGAIMVNSRAVAGAASASGVHINAYFGDVTGNGTIDGLDVATASTVAQGEETRDLPPTHCWTRPLSEMWRPTSQLTRAMSPPLRRSCLVCPRRPFRPRLPA